MSSLLAQVVTQLNSAIQRLDALAVAATRAQADIQEGARALHHRRSG